MKSQKTPTAADRYAINREDALRRLTLLTEYLNKPAQRELATTNWGHVGTVVRLNERLHELAGQLGLEAHPEYSA